MHPTTKVKLTTRTGSFVAFVEILTFTPPAEVIIWGARTFSRVHADLMSETPIYAEAVVAFSHTEPPGLAA